MKDPDPHDVGTRVMDVAGVPMPELELSPATFGLRQS